MGRRNWVGVVGAVVVCSAAGLTTFAEAAPRAVVESSSFDLGVIGLGEDAAHDFDIRNSGDSTLRLTGAQPMAGIRVEGAEASVAPGAVGRVRVTVDTRELIGKLVLPLKLGCDDPEHKEIALELKMEVRPFLECRPGYARFLYVQKAREGTIVESLGSNDGAAFRLIGVDSPHPYLRVEWREARPEERRPEWTGSQWRIEITLSADSSVGPIAGEIVARTDHPKQRRSFIPVSGFVRPIFAVTPPEARLGDIDLSRKPGLSLHVKNFAEEPIELKDASSDVAGVRVEIDPIEQGRTWKLKLSFSPEALPGPFGGEIRIRTASDKIPLILVPLSGRIVSEASPSSGEQEKPIPAADR